MESNWYASATCILVAAFFDMIDGMTARVFNASSRFGAELDSLSDAISFGVTPSLVLYLWLREENTQPLQTYLFGWYWIPFLFFTSCCVLRLARFNVSAKEPTSNHRHIHSFVGVPAPAAALLALLPILTQFSLIRLNLPFAITEYPYLVCGWIMVVSILMVSRIPTLSPKNLKITVSRKSALGLLVSTILLVAIFIKEQWLFFTVAGFLYFFSIPMVARLYSRKYEK